MPEELQEYTIHFEQRPTYLYAFVSGPKDTGEVSKKFWKEIHDKSIELNCHRLLVEEDFPNQLSTYDMYDVAKTAAAMFRGKVKIAHVDKNLSDLELNEFGETVSVNRGLINRVFNQVEAAEKWLLE